MSAGYRLRGCSGAYLPGWAPRLSGLGLYLWNRGACQVDAGTLAVMNNMLVPAGLLVNLVIWNREADLLRLLIGSGYRLLVMDECEVPSKGKA